MSSNPGKASGVKTTTKTTGKGVSKGNDKSKDKNKTVESLSRPSSTPVVSLSTPSGSSSTTSDSLSTPTDSLSTSIRLKRQLSSPEQVPSSKRTMGADDHSQLLASINELLDSKIKHLSTKDDVNGLREDIRMIQRENEKLVTQVKLLTDKCDEQEKRLEILENHVRRKNLIIRGCSYKKEDNIEEMARSFFSQVLKAPDPVKINESRRIGSKNGEGNLILVSLSSVSEKWSLINKANVLRNSGFSISQDFAPKTRLRRNKLLAVRAACRRSQKGTDMMMNLRGDRLFINNKAYHWDEKLGLATIEGGNLLAVDSIEGIDLKSLRTPPSSHLKKVRLLE